MDFIQLKIEKDSSMTKYITIVRKFDNSLSAKTIRRRINKNDFVTDTTWSVTTFRRLQTEMKSTEKRFFGICLKNFVGRAHGFPSVRTGK